MIDNETKEENKPMVDKKGEVWLSAKIPDELRMRFRFQMVRSRKNLKGAVIEAISNWIAAQEAAETKEGESCSN